METRKLFLIYVKLLSSFPELQLLIMLYYSFFTLSRRIIIFTLGSLFDIETYGTAMGFRFMLTLNLGPIVLFNFRIVIILQK